MTNPAAWNENKKNAAALNNAINHLMYDRGVELMIFRNPLNDVTIADLLSLHDYAEHVIDKPMDIANSRAIAEAILDMNILPSKIDLGKLNFEWEQRKANYDDIKSFVNDELKSFTDPDQVEVPQPVDVVLYGFGRIGRLCARSIIEQTGFGGQLRLKAIVTRKNSDDQIIKRAALLRQDSVHGPFKGVIQEDLENKSLIINGEVVKMLASNDPSTIDYTSYGINDALVIDNTGVWRDEEGLGLHLKSKGVKKVLLTAPGKGVPNVVYGVNHGDFNVEEIDAWSAASCTTNAIVPVIKIVQDNLGIKKGHIETIHAYTNDQNLLDNFHKKHRRGRSAAINMVITSTGAASAVSKVMPHLKDKLTGSAVRVPTPNGSLAIMNLELEKSTSTEEIRELLRNAALTGNLRNQIKYSIDDELVSNDIVGEDCCSVFDSPATKVSGDGKSAILYAWYDNEHGYTQQVIRLSKHIMNVRRKTYD